MHATVTSQQILVIYVDPNVGPRLRRWNNTQATLGQRFNVYISKDGVLWEKGVGGEGLRGGCWSGEIISFFLDCQISVGNLEESVDYLKESVDY